MYIHIQAAFADRDGRDRSDPWSEAERAARRGKTPGFGAQTKYSIV